MGKIFKRRKVIKFFLYGLGIWFLIRFLNLKIVKHSSLIKIKLKDIPENGALVVENKKIGIFKVNGEIFVMSLVCTHLGCAVKVTSEDIRCPCHGSVFDLKGFPVKGPAGRPLKRLKFCVKEEEIFIKV